MGTISDNIPKYDPIKSIQACIDEIRSKHLKLSLDETKNLVKKVEEITKKAIESSNDGMYYQHWCNAVYYLNSVYAAIAKLIQGNKITSKNVEEIRENSSKGVYGFMLFVTEHFSQIPEVIDLVKPVFTNTMKALMEFSKYLAEYLKPIIKQIIEWIQQLMDWTVRFIKENAGGIAAFTISSATAYGISRSATCASLQVAGQSAVVGASITLAEHCLIGGAIGLGTGILFFVLKEGYTYYQNRDQREKELDFMLSPEINAKEAEKIGLIELHFKIGNLIKCLADVMNENDRSTGRVSFSYEFSLLRSKLIEMRLQIPRVPNTFMKDNKND